MTRTELARHIVDGTAFVSYDQASNETFVQMRGQHERIEIRQFIHELLIERTVKPVDVERVKFYAHHGLASTGQHYGEVEEARVRKSFEEIEKLYK